MKKNKVRIVTVLLFIVIFAIITYINLRGTYLQYKELGDNYIQAFLTNLKYKYTIFGVNFIILYNLIYFTNKGIKKGLKSFFEKDKKQMPKLLNKSISFVISVIVSTVVSNAFMQKILLCSSNTFFGVNDPVFNLDISFYLFQKPLIQSLLIYFIGIVLGLTAYSAIYYVIVFNKYFDGVDGKMVKNSLLIKKMLRNIILIIILIALYTSLNITNILTSKFLTIKSNVNSIQDIDIIGAGYTEVVLQRWGYLIFSIIILIFGIKAVKSFKKGDTAKVIKNLLIIPAYLVSMFVVIIVFNLIIVDSNKLDKEKQYLENNIEFSKNAFNIDIEENNIENTGTITQAQVNEYHSIINNIKTINSDVVLKNLDNNQTGTGYYSYRNANISEYKINGENKLVYVSPREILNSGRTYNNKTYEYTHGMGQIVVDATSVADDGSLNYIQKDVSGKDDELGTKVQQIYFGLDNNDTIATNTKNKEEYDYTDESGKEYTSSYKGKAGLKLNFIDKLILGIRKGDLKLALSGEVTSNSKILINRNIIKRAKQAMPYLIYDENPYTVVTQEGKIVWVLDAYTVSSKYPYSQYISIEHDGIKEKINYIRNSVKIIIDGYDGTMKFYIVDKSDPIAMAYRNIYPTIFENINEDIPNDIAKHFIYPKYLYNVQSEMLKIYHNVKPDVLYRNDDLWNYAKYNNTIISKSSGTTLKPYYTMVNNEKIGLIQIYTPESKQNIISYLIGTTEGNTNKLKLYKFSQDSNVLGTTQLDNQIEQDEIISAEIKNLNTTGTKVTKDMVIVPIDNTLLYVESIYQTLLNEESKVPVLKKIIVASGNKVAIGNDLEEALNNLLSKDASNIEVENNDDIDGLIDSIVKANKNLSESTKNNDWELIGTDIDKLQTLINSLEKMKAEEDKKKEQEKKENSLNEENINSVTEKTIDDTTQNNKINNNIINKKESN